MDRQNEGRALYAALIIVAAAMLTGALSGLYAANNTAPTGWLMANRDRAKWAMGEDRVFWAHCSATNTLPATGLAATDVVWGVMNSETVGETQTGLSTTLTVATNSLTSSATPWTQGDMYLVFVHRPQASDR